MVSRFFIESSLSVSQKEKGFMMRRTASEILSDLEIRVARLENLTASETEADLSGVTRFLRESIYDSRELDLEELAESKAVSSFGDYFLVPLSEAERKVDVRPDSVFEDYLGNEFVLIHNESTPLIGSKYLVLAETLLSNTGKEVVNVMRKFKIKVRGVNQSLIRKIVRKGFGLYLADEFTAKKASFDYLKRDMDSYAFIPPFEVNREIRNYLRMSLREDLIEEKLMRKFKVNRARAQRMMSEYHRNKFASQRRFR